MIRLFLTYNYFYRHFVVIVRCSCGRGLFTHNPPPGGDSNIELGCNLVCTSTTRDVQCHWFRRTGARIDVCFIRLWSSSSTHDRSRLSRRLVSRFFMNLRSALYDVSTFAQSGTTTGFALDNISAFAFVRRQRPDSTKPSKQQVIH